MESNIDWQAREQIKQKPTNSKEAYLRILGTDQFPDSPEQMPTYLYLPPGALGDLETSILLFQTAQSARLPFWSGLIGYLTIFQLKRKKFMNFLCKRTLRFTKNMDTHTISGYQDELSLHLVS